ncbi:hypothetical protein J6590_064343 [Homalodisca vitripennis]|nr:hypothetical protein J6590_064343 [Homalodisca vitripennis]
MSAYLSAGDLENEMSYLVEILYAASENAVTRLVEIVMSTLPEGHTLDQVIGLRRYECDRLPSRVDNTSEVMCPREFDGWTCINATSAGDVAYFPCPFFILGFDPKRYGLRVCLEDGSWFKHPESNKTWSNYTTCVDMEDLQKRIAKDTHSRYELYSTWPLHNRRTIFGLLPFQFPVEASPNSTAEAANERQFPSAELRTQVNFIYKTGYTVSLAALIISIIIFFYFKSLTCTRIQIHKNLFISLALNNCLWLIWYEAVVDNLPVLMENRIECQLLHILVQYFLVATYFWMFCEGLYLHTLLVVTFVTETKVMPFLYPIGWGVPALLVALYAVLRSSRREEKLQCIILSGEVRAMKLSLTLTDQQLNGVFRITTNGQAGGLLARTGSLSSHPSKQQPRSTIMIEALRSCWIHESLYSWTLSGPVCVSMLANLVFLINIVRLLLTKLHTGLSSPKQSFRESLKHASFRSRRKASSTSQTPGPPSGRTKKAVRATLILIPLLGLQYIVMPFRPEQGASWEAIYQIASAVIASCQVGKMLMQSSCLEKSGVKWDRYFIVKDSLAQISLPLGTTFLVTLTTCVLTSEID